MHAKDQESVLTCNHVMYTPLYHICFTPGLLWHKERRYLLSPQKNTWRWKTMTTKSTNDKKKHQDVRGGLSCVPNIFLISEPLTEAWIIAKFSSFLAPPDSVTPQGRLRYWWVSSGQLPKYVGQAFEAKSWRWIQKCWDTQTRTWRKQQLYLKQNVLLLLKELWTPRVSAKVANVHRL